MATLMAPNFLLAPIQEEMAKALPTKGEECPSVLWAPQNARFCSGPRLTPPLACKETHVEHETPLDYMH